MEQAVSAEILTQELPSETSPSIPADWKRRFDKQTEFFTELLQQKDEEILSLEIRLASPEVLPERIIELAESSDPAHLAKASRIASEVYGIELEILLQALKEILQSQEEHQDDSYLQMIQEFNIRKKMEGEALVKSFIEAHPLINPENPEYSESLAQSFTRILKKLAPRHDLLPLPILEDHFDNAYMIATKRQYAEQTSDAIRKKIEIDTAIKKSSSRNTASHKTAVPKTVSPFAHLPKSL